MKNILPIGLLAVLLAFTSCKKNNNDSISPIIGIAVAVPPVDSTSITINGKVYTGINVGSTSAGSAPANESYDPLTNVVNWVGSPDSVTYFRSYSFANFNGQAGGLKVSFAKKYAKADLNQVSTAALYYPANPIELFTVGQRSFPVDFERERSHNGVAIETSIAGGGSSFSQIFLGRSTKLTSSSQSNSTFQVTSLTKQSTGGYILEAKFSVNLFDGSDNLITRIENGYVRIIL